MIIVANIVINFLGQNRQNVITKWWNTEYKQTSVAKPVKDQEQGKNI